MPLVELQISSMPTCFAPLFMQGPLAFFKACSHRCYFVLH